MARGQKLLLAACGALLVSPILEVSFAAPKRDVLSRPASSSADATRPSNRSGRRSFAGALPLALVTTLLVWQKGMAPAWALIYNKPPKPVIAQDKSWQQVDVASWVKSSKGQPDLVLGLRGEPYFLLPGKDGGAIRNFALKAECTHLGCLASWSRVGNKFVCPCHGSQYDENGSVLKGPAPQSLALAHVELTETQQVRLVPWTEEDFRDGSSPWWFA